MMAAKPVTRTNSVSIRLIRASRSWIWMIESRTKAIKLTKSVWRKSEIMSEFSAIALRGFEGSNYLHLRLAPRSRLRRMRSFQMGCGAFTCCITVTSNAVRKGTMFATSECRPATASQSRGDCGHTSNLSERGMSGLISPFFKFRTDR
jgi:hypothetical protein